MNKIILILIFSFCQSLLFGQTASQSVIKDTTYSKNPKMFLSKLDSTKITSGILIDRAWVDSLILINNGSNLVRSNNKGEWNKMYSNLWNAIYDSTYLVNPKILRDISNMNYNSQKMYSIGIIDCKFNKITQAALDNGDFVKNGNFLIDAKVTDNSFSNYRVVAGSCLDENISGDNVNFIINDLFFITNNAQQQLLTIEIDFGNGAGYRTVNFNQAINVQYGSTSGYIQLQMKLTFQDYVSGVKETLYSLNSLFRTASSTVPLPTGSYKTDPIGTTLLYYPIGIMHGQIDYYTTKVCTSACPKCISQCKMVTHSVDHRWWEGRKLEYNILFAPGNNSGKLRRPFIIVDGFDPGNRRDYYSTRYDNPGKLMEKDQDFRGLFQLLNGDPSPWYKGEADVNLIAALQNDKYDIIVVNFIDGAGDIPQNTVAFRSFLNDIVNSFTYRDNNTEEAILVGPSMGGLITRYALTLMEGANEDHFIKNWLSFDSPNQGANIPLGLQHSLDFLSNIHDSYIDALIEAKAGFKAGITTLNTPAALQLLLYHYTATWQNHAYPHQAFRDLNNQLNQLGYPKNSKNYAMTNGGISNLYYPTDDTRYLDFEIFWWTHVESWKGQPGGSTALFGKSETNSQTVVLYDMPSLENAPGGWNSTLYSLNCNAGNKHEKNDSEDRWTKAAFIITSSAFGMPVTNANLFKTWKEYTKWNDKTSGLIRTPFDEIKGMYNNEEHIKISSSTRDYLIKDVLRSDYDNSMKPQIREDQVTNTTVRGKVAYVAQQTLTFSGANNSFTTKNGADISIRSGNSTTFLPGFSAEPGTNLAASIQNMGYESTLRTGKISYKSADYSKASPYSGKIYDYSLHENGKLLTQALKFSVLPSPVKNSAQINLAGLELGTTCEAEIYNTFGALVMTIKLNNGITDVNLTELNNGLYFVKVISGGQTAVNKILKIE